MAIIGRPSGSSKSPSSSTGTAPKGQGDYTSESYKKIAAENAAKRKAAAGFSYVESGGGLAAVSGDVVITQGPAANKKVENVLYTPGGLGKNRSSAIVPNRSASQSQIQLNAQVPASNPYSPYNKTSPVSGPVYGKLSSQSIGNQYTYFVPQSSGNNRNINKPQSTDPYYESQRRATSRNLAGNSNDFNSPQALSGFQERVEASQQREERFYNSEGFQRVDDVSSVITFGNLRPVEQRSFLGRQSQYLAGGFMSGPIRLGGFLVSSGEKISATTEGVFRSPRLTFGELFVGAPKRVESGPFSFLPGGTPINDQGYQTLFIATGGSALGGQNFANNPASNAERRYYGGRVVPQKVIGEKGISSTVDYGQNIAIPKAGEFGGKVRSTILDDGTKVITPEYRGGGFYVFNQLEIGKSSGLYKVGKNFYEVSARSKSVGVILNENEQVVSGITEFDISRLTYTRQGRTLGRPRQAALTFNTVITRTGDSEAVVSTFSRTSLPGTKDTLRLTIGRALETGDVTNQIGASFITNRMITKAAPEFVFKAQSERLVVISEAPPTGLAFEKTINQNKALAISAKDFQFNIFNPSGSQRLALKNFRAGYESGSAEVKLTSPSFKNIFSSDLQTSFAVKQILKQQSFNRQPSAGVRAPKALASVFRAQRSARRSSQRNIAVNASAVNSVLSTRQSTRATYAVKIASLNSTAQRPIQVSIYAVKIASLNSTAQRPIQVSIVVPRTITGQVQEQSQIQVQKLDNPSRPRPPISNQVNVPAPPRFPIRFPVFFRMKLNDSGSGYGNPRARRVTGYVPSYSAIIFNIRGSYKPGKLSKSGLDFRPVTSNRFFSRVKVTRGIA